MRRTADTLQIDVAAGGQQGGAQADARSTAVGRLRAPCHFPPVHWGILPGSVRRPGRHVKGACSHPGGRLTRWTGHDSETAPGLLLTGRQGSVHAPGSATRPRSSPRNSEAATSARDLAEDPAHVDARGDPQRQRCLRRCRVREFRPGHPAHGHEGPVDGADHIGDADGVCGPGEPVPSAAAAPAGHRAGPAQTSRMPPSNVCGMPCPAAIASASPGRPPRPRPGRAPRAPRSPPSQRSIVSRSRLPASARPPAPGRAPRVIRTRSSCAGHGTSLAPRLRPGRPRLHSRPGSATARRAVPPPPPLRGPPGGLGGGDRNPLAPRVSPRQDGVVLRLRRQGNCVGAEGTRTACLRNGRAEGSGTVAGAPVRVRTGPDMRRRHGRRAPALAPRCLHLPGARAGRALLTSVTGSGHPCRRAGLSPEGLRGHPVAQARSTASRSDSTSRSASASRAGPSVEGSGVCRTAGAVPAGLPRPVRRVARGSV